MSCIAIGIGGTGARCIEALVHLCAMGVGPEDLKVLLIDPDNANGNVARTKKLVSAYVGCRESTVGNGLATKHFPFHTRIGFYGDQIDDIHWNPTEAGKSRLKDLFLMSSTPSKAADLCRAFYNDHELDMAWDVGFRGRASVAAAAMADIGNRTNQDPWAKLLDEIKTTVTSVPHRTFIFSSVFGATGAGGFPSVAQIMRNVSQKQSWSNRDTNFGIGGALLLPYIAFSSPTGESQKKEEMYAKAAHFLMNAQAAILHYGREWTMRGSPYDAVYVVGAPTLDAIDRPEVGGNFSVGGPGQANPAHMTELLAGLAALDFYSSPPNYKAHSQNPALARRVCRVFNAEGASKDSIAWSDLPKLYANVKGIQPVSLLLPFVKWATMQAVFLDLFHPRISNPDFEKHRDTVAWYAGTFEENSLTDGPSVKALAKLRRYSDDFSFKWIMQLHQTSVNRKPLLIDHSFLTSQIHKDDDSVRGGQSLDQLASYILHQDLNRTAFDRGKPESAHTAIWNEMCDMDSETGTAAGRFWQMLYSATDKYVNSRYKDEGTRTQKQER